MVTLAQGAVDQYCPLLTCYLLFNKRGGMEGTRIIISLPSPPFLLLPGSQLDSAEVMQPFENGPFSLSLG